jgi:hypothetical protein
MAANSLKMSNTVTTHAGPSSGNTPCKPRPALARPDPTDDEIAEWMPLFTVYRNRGKKALTDQDYERFKVLTKRMSNLLKNIV